MITTPAVPDVDPVQFLKIAGQGAQLRTHADLWRWLQGDVQTWLAHDVLLVGWGDFRAGDLQYDIVSSLPGLRAHLCPASRIAPLVNYFRDCWVVAQSQPCQLDISGCGRAVGEAGQGSAPAAGDAGHALGAGARRRRRAPRWRAHLRGAEQRAWPGRPVPPHSSCSCPSSIPRCAACRRAPMRQPGAERSQVEHLVVRLGAAVRARAPDHGLGRHGQDQPRDRLHPAHQRVHREEPHEEHLRQAGRDQSRPGRRPAQPDAPPMPEARARPRSRRDFRRHARRPAAARPDAARVDRLQPQPPAAAFEAFVEPLATVLSLWALVLLFEGELAPRWLGLSIVSFALVYPGRPQLRASAGRVRGRHGAGLGLDLRPAAGHRLRDRCAGDLLAPGGAELAVGRAGLAAGRPLGAARQRPRP